MKTEEIVTIPPTEEFLPPEVIELLPEVPAPEIPPELVKPWYEAEYYNIPLWQWLLTGGIAVGVIGGALLIKKR